MKKFNIFSVQRNQQDGFILPVLLITGLMIVLIIVAVSGQSVTNKQTALHANYAVNAQMAADAGLDYALNQMNTQSNWTGIGDTTLLSDATSNTKTTYAITVQSGADNFHKTLIATGKTFSPITASIPKVTRKYATDIQAVTLDNWPSSVVTGVGGLIMSGNAKVVGGDVIIDGTVNMSNGAQIGLSTNPINLRVADQVCPNPATSSYPQVCGAGSAQPIIMGTNSFIYGNVQATNQTNGTNMSNPGLIAGSSFAPAAMPSFDRTAFKNAVNASGQTMTGTAASNCPNGGTINWPANVKITGDISIQNKCTIKINGNVWITGAVNIQNNAVLAVQDSAGTNVPTIGVDGAAGFTLGNGGSIAPNAANTSLQIITFWSAAGCSPDCTAVTGTDLYNSQNVLTLNLLNVGSAPGAFLYAYWSKVNLANNGTLGAIAGQTVSLSNNSIISFGTAVPGSNNLITTWAKRGYMRVYN